MLSVTLSRVSLTTVTTFESLTVTVVKPPPWIVATKAVTVSALMKTSFGRTGTSTEPLALPAAMKITAPLLSVMVMSEVAGWSRTPL